MKSFLTTEASERPHNCIGETGGIAPPRPDNAPRIAWEDKRDTAGSPNWPDQPSASLVGAAHAEFVTTLYGHPPCAIPLYDDAIDLEDRAAHLSRVFGALSAYMAVILDDTAQNVPGRLDLPDVEAHLADLAADVTGIIERAAEDMPWRIA